MKRWIGIIGCLCLVFIKFENILLQATDYSMDSITSHRSQRALYCVSFFITITSVCVGTSSTNQSALTNPTYTQFKLVTTNTIISQSERIDNIDCEILKAILSEKPEVCRIQVIEGSMQRVSPLKAEPCNPAIIMVSALSKFFTFKSGPLFKYHIIHVMLILNLQMGSIFV